jgi:hypothetical protein
MPPRRASIRLYQQDQPPQESIIPPPHNQPSTQILSGIAKGADYPKFEDVLEMHLHQPMNTSVEAEPSHSIATSSQATEWDLCQPPPQEEELDHVQIGDWDKEAKEQEATAKEEELARVQQEIERLRQEQETIRRRQAAMQHAEAHRQNISRDRVRLTEMQYNLKKPLPARIPNQPPPTSPPHNHILHHPNPPPPPQTRSLQPTLPPQMGTTYPKSPLAEHLQLAPWPLQYRAVTPAKYNSNTDPRTFLMCYEAAIASVGGDEATLAKSLINSLVDAAANWYSRLPPCCIYSWQQLKDKILLNFQGFQAELDTEENFLLCIQKEREPLPEFYRRFLQLKA